MKKYLFIDRDGTLVVEPPVDKQLDSLEKLEFLPGVFTYLGKIVQELDYELVMVTNQDGLGTNAFPEDTFWPAHNKMMLAFENEGITFKEVLIDRSFPEDNAPTRKPETGLVTHYMNDTVDLKNSFVIGDRETDVELGTNMGCGAIRIGEGQSSVAENLKDWKSIYNFLKNRDRIVTIERNTNETKISVSLNLDGSGQSNINTGLNFFDHMLDQIAKHGQCDLAIQVDGDLEVDEHHTIEDVAIVLGQALNDAIGSKKGINRYGFLLPMDDCLAQVGLDLGGRPWLVWEADFKREMIGDMPTEMFMHFFKSLSDNAKCNLNIKAEGDNEHHKIESIFKAFAKALLMAKSKSEFVGVPSTKGSL